MADFIESEAEESSEVSQLIIIRKKFISKHILIKNRLLYLCTCLAALVI